MANKIQVKRSAVPSKVPTTSDLDLGEIAINTYDGVAYIKKDNGTASIVQLGGGSGSGDVVGPSSATDNALTRFDTTTGKLIQNSVITVSDTGAIAGATTITDINYVDFNTGYATTITTGQLGWDSTNNSLAFGMAGGNIVQHIGEDQYLYIKASATITKGQVIMFTGSVGASGVLTGAPATGITDGTYIIGIAAEAIANNAFGFVQTFGVLTNVNTSAFADADILWYDPSVTGGLTATKPSAPNVKAQVAACNKGGSAGGGVITVRVNPGSQLGGTDSNVQFGTLASGQTIIYDATAGYWKNSTLTAGTGISVTNGAGSITVTNSAPDQTVAISGTSPVSVSGTYPNFTLSMTQSSASVNGWLSSTDWNTFNSKQQAYTNLSTIGALANGTGWLYNNGSGTFSYSTPTKTDVGLSNVTNDAQTKAAIVPNTAPTSGQILVGNAGGTAYAPVSMSGDATLASTGATTLATVNSNVGSFTNASVTVNAKGLITAASNGTAPVTSVTGTSPISSSGGATPAISISQATTSTNGYLSSTDWNTFNNKGSGTVTSVAALTLGTTGTDLSSTVATGTTTPVITLNVPTASAANRGALSSADWTTFNGKQTALISGTNIKTVSGTSLLGAGDLGTIGVAYGGTGQTTYTNGQLLIGNTTGNTLTKATLTAGSGISITNGTGSITIASTGGSTPNIIYDQFTATAGQTTFTTSASYTSGKITVYKNGAKLRNGDDVTVTSGNQIVFAVACTLNDVIDADYPSVADSTKMAYDQFIATASQTIFTTSATYTTMKIDVYRNGAKMRNGDDVTVTSGSTIIFAIPLTAGDYVDAVYPV
jgi:hypothetical protein